MAAMWQLAVLVLCFSLGTNALKSKVFPENTNGQYLALQFGHCHNDRIKTNVDSDQFFNGSWYLRSSFGLFPIVFPNYTTCSTIQFKRQNESVSVLFYEWISVFQTYVFGLGTVNLSSAPQYIIQFPFFVKGNVPISFSVVETDYDHYAIIEFCVHNFGVKLDSSIILTRERDDAQSDSLIYDELFNAGLVHSDYIPEWSYECGDNPPSL